MATIDVDKLRDYMTDYFGIAMFNGFPAAILDLSLDRLLFMSSPRSYAR